MSKKFWSKDFTVGELGFGRIFLFFLGEKFSKKKAGISRPLLKFIG